MPHHPPPRLRAVLLFFRLAFFFCQLKNERQSPCSFLTITGDAEIPARRKIYSAQMGSLKMHGKIMRSGGGDVRAEGGGKSARAVLTAGLPAAARLTAVPRPLQQPPQRTPKRTRAEPKAHIPKHKHTHTHTHTRTEP